MARGERQHGERGWAARRAAKEQAEDVVASEVALRIGQVIWHAGTYPLRLLARALDALT